MKFDYDVIVIGAGHAGCEAARTAAHLGSKTLLITMDMNKIAQMSCNPAVGGIAKGQIVREIDALGGFMGIATDRTSIQFRLLNISKGPAMWSPRSQADRLRFIETWRTELEQTENLFIWQDLVSQLLVKHNSVTGVRTALGVDFHAPSVVLTAGTFLNGLMHVGQTQIRGGRVGEPASRGITEQLVDLGFKTDRMKTGTPVRIDSRSIDFSLTEVQEGDSDFHHFSFLPHERSQLKQRPCYIVYTNADVHRVLEDDIVNSPLYNGQINSIGPRYCPSIETKLQTFPDKDHHQLFIEPEGENTTEMYLNGFSSSMPWHTQIKALQHIPALRNLHVFRPGYAIEYDFFDPTQLYHTLETKLLSGLFFAGQVNGTTGYEEAAGQGLVAGVNAHAHTHGVGEFILHRDQAYIGVLIDDLVTKGVDEPYRMFTSRAEHRLLLRQDNADSRLTPIGEQLGLADSDRITVFKRKQDAIAELTQFLRETSVKIADINPLLEQESLPTLKQGCKLADLVLRPEHHLDHLVQLVPALHQFTDGLPLDLRSEIIEAVEIEMKYAGYIDREKQMAEKISRLDYLKIQGKFDYLSITQLSTEARQKLHAIDPQTIGQASRIPGISPSDINILLLLLGR